nr:immunoglobulin light chain junction region [Macaca mulatta]MOV94795.1 immunoglobulin light chain junction region [Macaca mulatta]MOV95760.1 immunoglobulin light chain junction region [Macaca mulatta]MOV95775.1 immunoglobulin light chain junction region [Macaca mulatta]MOV96239.1 immunoglobulin light chain junction region [Macaca mulatta]
DYYCGAWDGSLSAYIF